MGAALQHHGGAQSPIAQLRAEHEVILRALSLLEALGRELEAGKTIDRAILAWFEDFFSTFADRCHHGKEERCLFPLLERYGVPREGGPLGVMLYEHEQGRAFLRAMQLTTGGERQQTAEAIRGYLALLRAHIEKENQVLFRLAEQVLPDEAQRELAQSFEAAEQAEVGPGVHERYLSELAQLEASLGKAPEAGT